MTLRILFSSVQHGGDLPCGAGSASRIPVTLRVTGPYTAGTAGRPAGIGLTAFPAAQHLTMSTPLLLISALVALTAEPACTVGGSSVHAADEARALAACESARQRFAELFGHAAPRAHVVLHDQPDYEVALVQDIGVVFWPATPSLTRVAESPESPESPESHRPAQQWTEVLPHELMHALTMAHFYAHGSAVDSAGYGTPLPDWFEEGIAIWGEPAESVAGRLAQARRLPAERMDLHALLSGRHPAAANPGIVAAVPGAAVPADAALRAFYPQSIALVAYVHARGGAKAMAELGRRLHAEPRSSAVLAALPGLPTTMAAVERDWQEWLRSGH
jgi:hypothetical protein